VRISDLARAAEVGISTVRFYERRGLVTPAARTKSNYRSYDDAVLRVRFIRRAQQLGFTLTEIEQILTLPNATDLSLDDLGDVITEKVDQIEQRIYDLSQVRLALLDLARNGTRERCPVLAALADPEPGSACSREEGGEAI
jgi:DNA-binding transcriptional MerR regulator